MTTNVDVHSDAALVAQVNALLSRKNAGIEQARLAWFDIGALLLAKRRALPANREFGQWFDQQEFAEVIGRDTRAALIKLAMNRDKALALLRFSLRISPEQMLEQVEVLIVHAGGAPLLDWRDEAASSEGSEDAVEDSLDSPTPENRSPEPGNLAEGPVPSTLGPVISSRSMDRWHADLSDPDKVTLLGHYTNSITRVTVRKLSEKPGGRKVLVRIAAMVRAGEIATPSAACLRCASARLVIPELTGGPLAASYDLGSVAGLERLLADLPDIREFAVPAIRNVNDPNDVAGRALRRGRMLRTDAQRMVEVRQQQLVDLAASNADINAAGHPPVVVHGVQLWPDAHLPPSQRLTYEMARLCFRLWHDLNKSKSQPPLDFDNRAHSFQTMSRLLGTLDGDPLCARIGHFFHRAGLAMKARPEAEGESTEGRSSLLDRLPGAR
jgi:hypothetical protein